jgi:hypothetical protein
MKNMRIMLVSILMMMATVSCAQNSDKLIGKWFFSFLSGYPCVVEFTKTGYSFLWILEDRVNSGTYSADGKTLIPNDDPISLYEYTLSKDDTLSIIAMLKNNKGEVTFRLPPAFGKRLKSNITSLSGRYELAYEDEGLIQTFEFTDKTTVIAYSNLAGFTQKMAFKYKISGSNLIITTDRGSVVFEIFGDMAIKGDIFQGGIGQGNESIFIKE